MASRGVNKVILIGNLGADPELRYMPNGVAVANASVATSASWRDKQTGELIERTEWHRVAFFNRLAEIVGEYLRKGSKVYIEGSLRTRKWQDKSGIERFTTEVIANEMQILDSRNGGNNQHYHDQAHQDHALPIEASHLLPDEGSHHTEAPPLANAIPHDEDDIPF